jgi:hypothetical protein
MWRQWYPWTISQGTACIHADSHFLHLGGDQHSDCTECSAAVVAHNASVTVVSSRFESPYYAPGSRYIHVQAGALLSFTAASCCMDNVCIVRDRVALVRDNVAVGFVRPFNMNIKATAILVCA